MSDYYFKPIGPCPVCERFWTFNGRACAPCGRLWTPWDVRSLLGVAPPPLTEEMLRGFLDEIDRRAVDGGRCRACGCHDMDCWQCIEKTGAPCHWEEEDLCSACVT